MWRANNMILNENRKLRQIFDYLSLLVEFKRLDSIIS